MAERLETAESAEHQSFARMMCRFPALVALVAIAACSQVPTGKSSHESKVDPVWGVEAPKKMVADGQPVPPGGGRYQVGKPYMVGGRMYFPREQANYDQVGTASWYGADNHGRETANGEVYDKDSISAAHTTLPIPSYARVTNLDNGRSVIVRVNDRGPYVGNRLIDVSERTADLLKFKSGGLGHVRVQYVGPAPVEGSDQRMLVASLRGPGTPASVAADRVLIARADRTPSDGRMAGLAVAGLAQPVVAPAAPQQARPIILAAAIERAPASSSLPSASRPSSSLATTSASRPFSYGTQSALPAPIARPLPRPVGTQIAIATPQQRQYEPVATRPTLAATSSGPSTLAPLSPLKPTSLGTVPAHGLGTAAGTGPLQLGPARAAVAPAAPGAIARMPLPPVMPSRYGPAGQATYKVDPSQGFAETAHSAPAADAIDRLIAVNVTTASPHIDLGAYALPENAERVASLMQAYGEVQTRNVHGALGETLIVVELQPSRGMISGDVITIADRLGIHAASLVE